MAANVQFRQQWILTLGWFSAVTAHCGVEFQKIFFTRMFLGTYLVNAYFTIFFSHAHSGLTFLHVQTVLKVTSSAVQTLISRLEQSQS